MPYNPWKVKFTSKKALITFTNYHNRKSNRLFKMQLKIEGKQIAKCFMLNFKQETKLNQI